MSKTISLKSLFLICVLLFLITIFLKMRTNGNEMKIKMTSAEPIYACDFEVFGRVQGVFFRKYTQKTAKSLNIYGWCQNTPQGTVRGQLEGPKIQLEEMKDWLRLKGSPQSRIDKTIFSETKQIDQYHFKEFSIKR